VVEEETTAETNEVSSAPESTIPEAAPVSEPAETVNESPERPLGDPSSEF
jgi:hypothetical protein